MNRYQIHYFGLLAERRGLADEEVTSSSTNALDLYTELAAIYPLKMVHQDLRAAVNDEFVAWNHPLQDCDKIAFLPPMSGG